MPIRPGWGAGEALLAFRGDLLVGANRLALRALELSATALGVYRHEDLFEDALAHAPDATGRVQARNGAVYHARLSLPPSPAPRALPASERGQPRATAPAPAAVSLDAAALDALGRAVHLMDAGVSILLQGETGAGKEVFARQMHARSGRAAGPFVAVNCAALPESLIESELFGYEDGAFTGARRQGSKGLLRQAHGGVLFLDEIGDMPLALQSRLLRVLQEREVSPLGAARPVPVDFALLCATHRPLAHEGADAPVRPDLYFRIAEYTVTLGPLRGGGPARAAAHAMERAGRGDGVAARGRAGAGQLRLAGQLPAAGLGAAHVARAGRPVGRGGPVDVAGGDPARGRQQCGAACATSARGVAAQPAGAGRRRHPRGAGRAWRQCQPRGARWACTAARCTGAWPRWTRPGRTAVGRRDRARSRSDSQGISGSAEPVRRPDRARA